MSFQYFAPSNLIITPWQCDWTAQIWGSPGQLCGSDLSLTSVELHKPLQPLKSSQLLYSRRCCSSYSLSSAVDSHSWWSNAWRMLNLNDVDNSNTIKKCFHLHIIFWGYVRSRIGEFLNLLHLKGEGSTIMGVSLNSVNKYSFVSGTSKPMKMWIVMHNNS